ncbi:hypothetical protein [Pedobacter sp. Leaf250]|uniref:hypothetical protein n=1 Tax=Pedobacter sp. Leaf250 TaxID=2876559 RepID=UPI001E3A1F40|nr:hypothetical protein [Pedobacter sp. Leaf250]
MSKEKKFATLEEAVAHIKEQDSIIETHDTNIAIVNQKVLDLEKERDDALAEVGVIAGKLDLQAKHGNDGTIVEIGKKNYKLSGNRFITKDGEKNAEEVSKDQDYLKHLLKIKSGVLTAID